jgi:hypothetical protein
VVKWHVFDGTWVDQKGVVLLKSAAAQKDFYLLGAYHYFRTSVPWQDQVNVYLDAIEELPINCVGVDLEFALNIFTIEKASHFVLMVKELNRRLDMPVLVYSSPTVITEIFLKYPTHLAEEIDYLRDYEDLWIAQWISSEWSDWVASVPWDPNKHPWLPAGFEK